MKNCAHILFADFKFKGFRAKFQDFKKRYFIKKITFLFWGLRNTNVNTNYLFFSIKKEHFHQLIAYETIRGSPVANWYPQCSNPQHYIALTVKQIIVISDVLRIKVKLQKKKEEKKAYSAQQILCLNKLF